MISDQQIDLKVERNQRIVDVIRIVAENMNFSIDHSILEYVYSDRRVEMINVLHTFETAEIYSGDLLKIVG